MQEQSALLPCLPARADVFLLLTRTPLSQQKQTSFERFMLLQAEVGIRKQHTATIADDIRRRVEADLKDSSSQGAPAQRKVTLCVEGNISAGKSTFLSLMKEHADLSGMIDVRVLGFALQAVLLSGGLLATCWGFCRL